MKHLITILLIALMTMTCADDAPEEKRSVFAPDVGDDDSGNDDADNDFVDAEDFTCQGEVCIDSVTGLIWQNDDAYSRTWREANRDCPDLDGLGGFHGWRLPTISELRSLIRGCPATETGGECGVTDDCLGWSECSSDACRSCDLAEGPGIEGRYCPEDLEGDGSIYWSSSEQTDGESSNAWTVVFHNGDVSDNGVHGVYDVRCVYSP